MVLEMLSSIDFLIIIFHFGLFTFRHLCSVSEQYVFRHLFRKKNVLSCHRCLIHFGIEKNEQHLNIDLKFDNQMAPSKRECWYSKDYLFSERFVPFLGVYIVLGIFVLDVL